MKKYKTTGTYGAEIQVVEIIKETEKTVTIAVSRWGGESRPERYKKVTSYDVYHDTWELARKYLIKKVNAERDSAKRSLDMAQERVEAIELISLHEG